MDKHQFSSSSGAPPMQHPIGFDQHFSPYPPTHFDDNHSMDALGAQMPPSGLAASRNRKSGVFQSPVQPTVNTAFYAHVQGGSSGGITRSQGSPTDLSPQGPDSPCPSFTSAHSELGDQLIDDILSLQHETYRRQPYYSGSYAQEEPGSLTNSYDMDKFMAAAPRRKISNSAPNSTLNIPELLQREMSSEDGSHDNLRDRRKKDVHNMIERRRRYNINDRIKELGQLLPKSAMEDMKMNKGSILKAGVDYIRRMQSENIHQTHAVEKQRRLQAENQALLLRVQALERAAMAGGQSTPNAYVGPVIDITGSGSSGTSSSHVNPVVQFQLGRQIKSEPQEAAFMNDFSTAIPPVSSSDYLPQNDFNFQPSQQSLFDPQNGLVGQSQNLLFQNDQITYNQNNVPVYNAQPQSQLFDMGAMNLSLANAAFDNIAVTGASPVVWDTAQFSPLAENMDQSGQNQQN